jgi:hypothetical protein
MAVAYADAVVPSGAQNSSNQVYGLPSTPNPVASLKFYYNGILQDQGVDYTLVSQTVTYTHSKPAPGDVQAAYYRYQV